MAALEVIALDTSVPQLMAPQAGDTYTFPRAVEMPLGTANGVLYLDGSKVVTSGSALTFDGTSLGVGTSDYGNAGSINVAVGVPATATGGLQLWSTTSGSHYMQFGDATAGDGPYRGAVGYNHTLDALQFFASGSEKMVLTSTGLGIGATSPLAKLDVVGGNGDGIQYRTGTRSVGIGQVASEAAVYWGSTTALTFFSGSELMRLDSSGNLGIGTSSPLSRVDVRGATGDIGFQYIETTTGNTNRVLLGAVSGAGYIDVTAGVGLPVLQFRTVGNTQATLDSSGNLGLGVTPSAWATATMQLGNQFGVGPLGYSRNGFWDGSWKYITTAAASLYTQNTGQHQWFTAPSGTAGDPISFTQAMTLDASGSLLVGSTSGTYRLSISVSSGADRDIFLAGVTGTSNGFHVRWINSTGKTHVIIADIPTSSAGLSAGTLWNDGGTLKIA